jgi:hypothetical protein
MNPRQNKLVGMLSQDEPSIVISRIVEDTTTRNLPAKPGMNPGTHEGQSVPTFIRHHNVTHIVIYFKSINFKSLYFGPFPEN